MKQHLSFLILSSIIFTTGCWSSEASNQNPLGTDEASLVVLFSDESSLHKEGEFYDALLDVRNSYPDKVFPLKIVNQTDRALIRHYEIIEYPTMLVVNRDGVTLRAEGAHQKEEIVSLLKEAFNIEEGTLIN